MCDVCVLCAFTFRNADVLAGLPHLYGVFEWLKYELFFLYAEKVPSLMFNISVDCITFKFSISSHLEPHLYFFLFKWSSHISLECNVFGFCVLMTQDVMYTFPRVTCNSPDARLCHSICIGDLSLVFEFFLVTAAV